MSEIILSEISNSMFANGSTKLEVKDHYAVLYTKNGAHTLYHKDMIDNLSTSTIFTTTVWVNDVRYDVSVEVMKRTAVLTWRKVTQSVGYSEARCILSSRFEPIGTPASLRGSWCK